jgi:D-xylose transport system substrate-binding protein
MSKRRMLALSLSGVLALAACTSSGGGATSAPSSAAPSESAGASGSASASASTGATDCTVAVSWNNYQQPRWAKNDQPNIKKTVEDGGGKYIDADANLSNEQQLTDINNLIGQGAKVLILLGQDTKAVLPGVQAAKDAGVKVIAYDRLIEDPDIFYITFDNVGVGKAEADAILKKVPEGNYVLIKGDPGDPNASTFLPQGWDEAGLKPAVDANKIKILNMGGTEWPKDAGTYTDAWKTEKAQQNMEAIIDKAVADGNKIDAILAENDSTALGVAGALTSKSYGYPPLSGQDGDEANLQNVAAGIQYVDVWKNANELGKVAGATALSLCQGTDFGAISLPDGLVDASVAPKSPTPQDFTTPGGNTVKSYILQPTPITAENLNLVVDGGWITKDKLCEKAASGPSPAAFCS